MNRKKSIWTDSTEKLVSSLHSELALNNNNWHELKTNNSRRAAELLISALSQIIKNGSKDDIEALIEQSLLWIKGEIKDPGCPSH